MVSLLYFNFTNLVITVFFNFVLLRIWQYFPKSAKLGEFTLEKHIPLEFSQVLL
jgi:hypothetical protein